MVRYTPAKIGKLVLFYLIFYGGLSVIWGLLMNVFYRTLDPKEPKWKLKESLIGTNPALGFRPMGGNDMDGALIRYIPSNFTNTKDWTDKLDHFLELYRISSALEEPFRICDNGQPPENKSEICHVPIENWYPCVSSYNYSYNSFTSGPCIFLKLNKIFGWEPDYYNAQNMDNSLPDHIKHRIRKVHSFLGPDSSKLKIVWVSCEGETPADIENIGPIVYFPDMGFDGQYFPYLNTKGYLSPLVAVYFEKPTRGILINVECKAWAKNIIHNRAQQRGSIHFEILLEP